MYRHHLEKKPVRLVACTAMAAVLVAGFAVSGDLAMASASHAFTSKEERKLDKVVSKAERKVEKHPQRIEERIELANTYLRAGRFEAAVTTFEDAQYLGDKSVRTALTLALAHIAVGDNRQAVDLLDEWRDSIPAGDLGLALALAGETSRGVAILSDALRSGENTPKLRQNLAYAYALDGRWREARLMAAQDVPADKLDDRISSWAMTGREDDYRKRVAAMLDVPVRSDPGQPQHLALVDRVAPEATALAVATPATSSSDELPPVSGAESFWNAESTTAEPVVARAAPAPVEVAEAESTSAEVAEADRAVAAEFAQAFAPVEPEPATTNSVKFVSRPVIQAIPAKTAIVPTRKSREVPALHGLAEQPDSAEPVAAAEISKRKPEECTHRVQLGSFSSKANADRAWRIFVSRNPELKNFDKQVSQAVVRGKTYWRVAAAGFDKRAARSMCAQVKGRGGGCFAYSVKVTLPGTVPGSTVGGAMRARR